MERGWGRATSSPTSFFFRVRVRLDGGPAAPSATLCCSSYAASASAPMRHSHSHVLSLESYPAHLTRKSRLPDLRRAAVDNFVSQRNASRVRWVVVRRT